MKKLRKLTLLLALVVTLIVVKDKMYASTVSGHYTYDNNSDGAITITKYDNTAANNLVIPDKLDGKTVTSIGVYAFSNCSSLTGNLTIPNSVTSIGDFAFDGCSGLTGSLTIPDSVTSIGRWAFYNCSGLTDINVSSDNKYYSSQDGILFNKDKTTLIQCPIGKKIENYVIPNSVTSIGADAFYMCSGLTGSLTIPNSVTSIGANAFEYCSGLTGSLTIPNSVTSIGDFAFYYCSSLTGNLTIPNSVTNMGERTFGHCIRLTSLTIENSVTSIGGSAFENCSGLISVTIGNSITSIGDFAFDGCSGLTGSLTIPDSVTSIGDYAFFDCSGLTDINVSSDNKYYSSQDGVLFNKDKTTLIQCPSGKKVENYVIPNSVTSIGAGAFYMCSGLTGSLTIPNSVTSIGANAFEYCSGLTGSLTIPDSVTSIGKAAFEYCSGLTSLTIGNSVTSIGAGAFYMCSGLTGSLTIPDSVTSIGRWAFYNCSGLTSITIPDSVTSIEDYAFYYCNSLDKIVFIGNAPTIEDKTFASYEKSFYYRKGTTGYDTSSWPQSKMVEYDESLEKNNFVFNSTDTTGQIKLGDKLEDVAKVSFSSENSNIATVSDNGLVTPIANGNTNIIVSLKYSDNITRTLKASVTVDVKVTSVRMILEYYTFYNDTTPYQLNAKVSPANANNSTLKWVSSDTSIATVSDTGLVTPVNLGTCDITATTTDGTNLSAKCTVKVDIKATSISLDKTKYTITDSHETVMLKPKTYPTLASQKVSWVSSDTSIATVSDKGLVTPVKSGTCDITATTTDGTNLSATCKITVDVKVTSVKLNTTSHTFTDYQPLQLTSTVSPSIAKQNVTWKSSNEKVAKVSSSGFVTPISRGTCNITATATDSTGLSATCNIVVDAKATGIKLDKTSYTFDNNNALQLTSTVTSPLANQNVTWTSSDEKVAKVSSSGKVIATGKGTCDITATTTDGTNLAVTCKITSNVTYMKGDINKDGVVNVNDAYYGLKGFTKGTISEEEKIIGDVNSDGVFNINDIYKLLKYTVGKISSLD